VNASSAVKERTNNSFRILWWKRRKLTLQQSISGRKGAQVYTLKMAENLEKKLIDKAGTGVTFDSWEFAGEIGVDHEKVVGTLKSLWGAQYVDMKQQETRFYTLTDEAEGYIQSGSPEFQFLRIVSGGSIAAAEAKKHSIGFGKCMRNKWLKKEGDGFSLAVKLEDLTDELQSNLKTLKENDGAEDCLDKAVIKDMNKRKLLKLVSRKHYTVNKGQEWAPERKKFSTTLTKEMIETGSWKSADFKETNWNSTGLRESAGYLHPLLLVRMEYRKILIGMGFEEMPTNKWVESSFWNFDALFQPQQHPARDAHDTFFIKQPASCTLESVPKDYVERVKTVHEIGGDGSIGYRYDWSLEESKKNILRTHTTAVSTRMLYQLGVDYKKSGVFKPKKYFSIDRVFRNEHLDATHLAEFHQVEGLVADRNLSLGDLIGVIKTFFAETGITEIRFKPAYNPYTEPSMEIFGYHPDLGKWTELGNSGMFRPEMLAPMGLPKDVRVIAWGLSLERPTMIKYRIKKIKELFGHKISLETTQTSPLPRLDGRVATEV